MTTLDEVLAARPADEQNVAAHKQRMEAELAAEKAESEAGKIIWRHSDWD
jgi:hypothetical protein